MKPEEQGWWMLKAHSSAGGRFTQGYTHPCLFAIGGFVTSRMGGGGVAIMLETVFSK